MHSHTIHPTYLPLPLPLVNANLYLPPYSLCVCERERPYTRAHIHSALNASSNKTKIIANHTNASYECYNGTLEYQG